MIGLGDLPADFEAWNRKWAAPHGGIFGLQANSPTRAWEYPWVASQLKKLGARRMLEIGGALSGLQFVLAKELGAEVVNVDPFFDYGNGPGEYAESPETRHAAMNRSIGTNVLLCRSVLEEAQVAGPFDAVYSVSTLEHMPIASIEATVRRADELLAPGGHLVLTIDLFLDVRPFCSAESNKWGTNINVAWFGDLLDYTLVEGQPAELFGFSEFSTDHILRSLGNYATYRSQLAQCAVFRKPS